MAIVSASRTCAGRSLARSAREPANDAADVIAVVATAEPAAVVAAVVVAVLEKTAAAPRAILSHGSRICAATATRMLVVTFSS